MLGYRWRLARPGWLAGGAILIAAIALTAVALGWSEDVAGTVFTAHRMTIVLATVAAAAFKDRAAAVLDATAYHRKRRRLAPPGLALVTVGPVVIAWGLVQAVRLDGVPWPTLALESAGMCAIAGAAGAWTPVRADPGLIGAAVPTLLVLVAETTPLARYLDDASTWAVLTPVGAVLLLVGLRDPARQAGRSVNRWVSLSSGPGPT
jgi:hypothetical protein